MNRFGADADIIRECELFGGLDGAELDKALEFYGAETGRARKGDFLLRTGEPVRRFGLVLEGTIHASADDINGDHMIMASVSRGGVFAEALCFLEVREAPLYICAMTDVRILWMRTEALKTRPADAAEAGLHARFTTMLSRKLLEMNDRVQVLYKKRTREKLTTYFTQCVRDARSREFVIPFDREGLAAYLGVNRAALSRELSAMRREGLISFKKNRFVIKGAR